MKKPPRAMTYKDLFLVEPYEYQNRGISYGLKHSYNINGDQQGLGKTLQALGVALLKSEKTLVVCPAYLRQNWVSEIEGLSALWRDSVAITSAKDFEKIDYEETDFIIISYHFIPEAEELFKWCDMVIADECQHLKNLETSWTMCFHYYMKKYKPERFMALSGTPIENGIVEWFSILTLMGLSPQKDNGERVQDIFGDNYKAFCRYFAEVKYVKIGKHRWAEKYEGIRNRGRLKKLLRGKYLRRLAKDELELPKLLRKNVTVSYSDDPELLEAWNNHVSRGSQKDTRAKTKSAFVKAPYTAKYARDLFEERRTPILIFTDHRGSCEKIAQILKCPEINGSTSEKKREEITAAFQAKEISYLVATIPALCTGKTLTASRDVVFNDKNWNPAKNDQAIHRIYRIGQEEDCLIHNIIGSPQDYFINSKLDNKWDSVTRGT